METSKEQAKQKILAAVKELEAANRQALLEEVGSELNTPLKDADSAGERFHKRYISTIALLLLVTLGFAGWMGGDDLLDDKGDTKTLLMLLGFVVALASYLASVARETVKRLGTLDKSKKDERLKLKRYVAWTTTAEIQLVLLGVMAIIRIAVGPKPFMPSLFISQPILLDNFLVIYLCSILILLSWLHLRVWMNECAFKHG